MTISELFSSTLLAFWYRRDRPAGTKPARRAGMLRKLLAVALPVSASALAGNLLSSANTVLVPQRLMASGMPQSEAVGALGVALGMALPLFLLPMAFVGPLVMVMLPRLSEGCATGAMDGVHRRMGKALYAVGLIALPVVAALAPIGQPVCRLLYGQELPPDYLLILAAAMVFTYYQIVTAGMLNGTGLQSRAMMSTIIGDVLQLAITWFTVANPAIGIYGFLWGMLLGAALSAALNFIWLIQKKGFRVQWARWIAQPWLAAAVTGLTTHNIFSLTQGLGWADLPSMAWAMAAGALACLLCLKIQGVRFGEYLRQLVPKKLSVAPAYGFHWFYF